MVVSLASAFMDTADAAGRKDRSTEASKPDGARTALSRLRPRRTKTYRQRRFVLAVDSRDGCGPVFALAEQYPGSSVVTLKEGRTPAGWPAFQALRPHGPENQLRRLWGHGRVHEFRGVSPLDYQDRVPRRFPFNALECYGDDGGR